MKKAREVCPADKKEGAIGLHRLHFKPISDAFDGHNPLTFRS